MIMVHDSSSSSSSSKTLFKHGINSHACSYIEPCIKLITILNYCIIFKFKEVSARSCYLHNAMPLPVCSNRHLC